MIPPPAPVATLVRASHVGFTVASLEAALAFWTGTLHCPAEPVVVYPRAFMETLTGVPGAEGRAAIVHAPGLDIELLEFSAPADRGRSASRPCDVGFVHLCFEVADIAAVIAAAAAAGWVPQGAAQPVPGGPRAGTLIVYLRNVEGLTLELTQRPRPGGSHDARRPPQP